MSTFVDKLNAKDDNKSGNQANEERARGGYRVAACRDGDKPGQGAVQCHRDVRLFVADPGDDHDGDRRGGSGKVCGEEDASGGGHALIAGNGDGGAAVEAEPAEPENKHAKSAERQAVAGDRAGLAVLVILADAGPEDLRTHQSGHAANHMHGCGAREIMEAQLGEPAAAPDPVAGDGIDECADDGAVDAVGDKLGALRHGAGNDGGGGGAEHGLENRVGPQRHREEAKEAVVLLNEEVEAADQRAGAREHKAKTEKPENRGTDGKVHQVFHDDIAGVLGSCKSGLHHGETGLHKEHQCRTQQHPDGVSR